MAGPFRLVALDLDGTLLDDARRCGPRTRHALDELEARGIEIMVCTGRRYRIALPMMERIGRRPVIAVQNGVLVRRSSDHETLARHLMGPEDVAEVVDFLQSDGLAPIVFVDRHEQGVDFIHDREHRDDPYWSDIFQRHRDHFLRVPDVAADDVVLVAAWHEAERLREMEGRFARAFRDRLAHHTVTNVKYVGSVFETYSPSGTKAAAVRDHRRRLGIAAQEVCAIGDDRNDLGMIREAGLGIAMGNAVEEVKAAADEVTLDCDREGVAAALRRWVLG